MLDETGNEIEIGVSEKERAKRRAVLDKTTGKDLKQKWNDEDRKDQEAKEKAIAPPPIYEKRCATCNHPNRLFIEYQLVKGIGYETIANALPEEDRPSRKSIKTHYEHHTQIDHRIVRAELEAAADLLNQNYEVGKETALTNKGIINVIVQKAYDEYIKGMITAEVKDIVQLIKLLNEMNSSTAQIKNEEAELVVRIFMMAIQNICDTPTQQAIGEEVKRLRKMDEVEVQVEAHLQKPGQLIEGEAIDDDGP